ncbi:hypothetical protein Q9966_008157 [Columba livia]|nr:hypothetical protein Q9966_008157 [Columba livia]
MGVVVAVVGAEEALGVVTDTMDLVMVATMEVVLAMAAEEGMVVEEDQGMETQVVDMEVEEEDTMATTREEILEVVVMDLEVEVGAMVVEDSKNATRKRKAALQKPGEVKTLKRFLHHSSQQCDVLLLQFCKGSWHWLEQ